MEEKHNQMHGSEKESYTNPDERQICCMWTCCNDLSNTWSVFWSFFL